METEDKEMPLPEKIKYAGYAARIFMACGIIFICYALAVRILTGTDTNSIAGLGLVFVALFGIFVWMKKTLEKEQVEGLTFYKQG
jgi:LPXTG-motif cell wall-anchored protein